MGLPVESSPPVVVLGAMAVDMVACVPVLPQADEIVLAESLQRFPGGSGGNAACGVARLGGRVSFLGKVGDDEDGRCLVQALADNGVDTRCVRVQVGGHTASCFIAVDGRGRRVIYSLGGVALLESPAELDAGCLATARLLYIADAFVDVALAACQMVRANGATVVFAPGGLMTSAGAESLMPILAEAGVLIASQAEARALTGEARADRAAARLARWGPQVVMVTLGGQGVLLASASGSEHIAAYPVEGVRDTTGAGDAFAVGVITGHLKGMGWSGAARLGCAVAAAKITHLGPRRGYPGPEELDRLCQALEREGLS